MNLEGRRNSGGHRRGENTSILRESKSIETGEKEKERLTEGNDGTGGAGSERDDGAKAEVESGRTGLT